MGGCIVRVQSNRGLNNRINRLMMKSIFVIALTGLAFAPSTSRAQTLQKSFLTASELIAAGGATSSFCVEFPASSGMFFVAVAFSGSDTFVSTTTCDPSTFVSTIGGTGSNLTADLGDTADFLLNGFQNFMNVLGNVQAQLDRTEAPQERAQDGNFPDILPPVEPSQNGSGAPRGRSSDNADFVVELQLQIDLLEKELADLEEDAASAGSVDDLLAKDHPIQVERSDLGKELDKLQKDGLGEGERAQEIRDEISELTSSLQFEMDNRAQREEDLQTEIKHLKDEIRQKQQLINDLQKTSDVRTLPGVSPSGNPSAHETALAYRTDSNAVSPTIFTPLLTQSNTQGFLLDLDAMLRRRTPGQAVQGPWNFWLQGSVTLFDDDQAADRDGQFWQFLGGGSYRINDRFTVGGLVTYNHGNVTSNAIASSLNSNFAGIGAFARTNVHDGLMLDTVINYQHGWNDINIAGATGSFDSDSIDIAAGLSKRFHFKPDWWLEPNLSLSYSNIHRSAYTDSTGAAVASSNIEQGRFTFGPKIGHIFAPASGSLSRGEIYLGLNGVVDFISNGDASVGNGLVANDPGSGVQVSSGLNLTFENGWDASASATYMNIGTLDSFTASLNLRIPLN